MAARALTGAHFPPKSPDGLYLKGTFHVKSTLHSHVIFLHFHNFLLQGFRYEYIPIIRAI